MTIGTSRLFAVFIDGLSPDSIKHMPYVASLAPARRLRTELGYSITCHSSMYTGVPPSKHLHWFIWQRNEATSPFKWLRKTGFDRLPDSAYTRYALYRATHLVKHNTAFFSVPFPAFVPLRQWHHFDVTEKKLWTEPGFNAPYPTVFELMRGAGVQMHVAGMDRQAHHNGQRLGAQEPVLAKFTYLFFGDIDFVSHRHGRNSPEALAKFKEVDATIEKWHRAALAAGPTDFILWSDHGHSDVTKRVDVRQIFQEQGLDIDDYIHMVDANYVRFWFETEQDRQKVASILPGLGPGFIVTPQLAKEYGVDMPDDRYGQLIYYLDPPAMFHKGSLKVMGRELSSPDVSMHGYRPDLPVMDGVLVSTVPVTKREPNLRDIAATLLAGVGLAAPPHFEGESLWPT